MNSGYKKYKNQKYEWAREQEEAFQTLKDNLCNAPVLLLPDGPEDFVVYCDASNQGLGYVLMQRGKSSVKGKILATPGETSKAENASAKMLRGLDQQMEKKEDGSCIEKALGTPLDMSAAHHPQTDGQSEHTLQTLEDMLRVCVIDFSGSWDVHLSSAEFSYNNSYHSSVRCASFEALYGRKCRLKAARDFQNSYVDNRCKQLGFEVGDKVILEVSSWKGVLRLERKAC
ncbi:putative reverse transcriptase domain-containing protein [Tanacetum coccineum]